MLKMKKFMMYGLVAMALAFSSCKTANKAGDDGASGVGQGDLSGTAGADDNTMGDSDSGKASGLQTIHFPYDSFEMDSEGRSTLQSNAEILKSKPNLKVQVEGHCDQRGGIQYNIALGEKRANAVKNALKSAGISADRISTISYGKEKPLDPGSSEAAYAKNRRANFAVTSR